MRRGGRGYPGRAAPPVGAEFGYPPKRLDRAAHPLAGPSPSPRGLPVILARAPRLWAAVAVRGCSARVVGLPHTGRWVLGWCWCLRRVVWLSAAIIVVHCFALFCCTCVLRAFVCWQISLRVSACSLVLRCLVRCVASMSCPPVIVSISH